MKDFKLVRLLVKVTSCLIFFALASANAAEFPTRPITIIVSLAPGGAADILARAVALRMAEELKQPVIVENKAGANTQVGANFVAKAEPDGYTLLATPDFTLSVNPFLYERQGATAHSLVPVAGLGEAPMALVVANGFPARDMASLIAWAKEHPGKLNFGVPGIGSTSHLGMELLQARAGIKVNPVPYKGAAPALTDLMAGNIDAVFVALGLVNGAAKAGKLRIIGIGDAKRLDQFPELPSIAETVPGSETTIWFGLFAPRGTAPDIIAKLNEVVRKVVSKPDFEQKVFAANAYQSMHETPDELSHILEGDTARWGKLIHDTGITVTE